MKEITNNNTLYIYIEWTVLYTRNRATEAYLLLRRDSRLRLYS